MNGFSKLLYLLLMCAIFADRSKWRGCAQRSRDEDYLPQVASYEEAATYCHRSLDATRWPGLACLAQSLGFS